MRYLPLLLLLFCAACAREAEEKLEKLTDVYFEDLNEKDSIWRARINDTFFLKRQLADLRREDYLSTHGNDTIVGPIIINKIGTFRLTSTTGSWIMSGWYYTVDKKKGSYYTIRQMLDISKANQDPDDGSGSSDPVYLSTESDE
jgi:hypothetical protein